MTNEQFNILLNELDGTSLQTLKDKATKYAANSGDILHNFRIGAQADGSTMAQTVWHYWKKHFVALMDKIQNNDWSNREDTKEKIQDSINYLRFIWAISEEERNKSTQYNSDVEYPDWTKTSEADCYDCEFSNCDINEQPCSNCKNSYAPLTKQYRTLPLKFQPKT